jgi:cytoskeletal protein CcmA (bactofilin family)
MSLFGGRKTSKTPGEGGDSRPAPKPSPLSRQPVGFDTVLGANTTLLGELRSQADVRLDGTFEGTLEIEGNVLVGETGKVNADIHARNVSVAGAVRGDISGKKVQLLRTARVWGNISAAAITTEEGAFIDGKLTMVEHDASTQGLDLPSLPAPKENDDDGLEVVEGEAVGEDDS